MSNFLTNLAKRSFSSAAGIRPRLASAFEPVRVVADVFPDPDVLHSLRETVVVQDAEAETSGSSKEPGGSPTAALNGSRDIGRLSSYGLANPWPEDDPSAHETFAAESRPQSLPGTVQQSQLLTPVNRNTEELSFEEKVSGSTISKSDEPRYQETLGFPSRPEPKPFPMSPMMEKRRSASLLPTLTMSPEPKSMSRGQSKVAANPLVPDDAALHVALPNKFASRGFAPDMGFAPKTAHAKEKSMPRLEQQRPEAEPSIHVTIGRVEVRAELASNASRQKDRTPSVVMGLEEYLRRHAKRGRE
jgi:hypothetical protein